jgi:hypothetical protein
MQQTTLEGLAAGSLLRRFANIADHDIVIWLGDLNYRIDLPLDDVMVGIQQKDWALLTACDQLRTLRFSCALFVFAHVLYRQGL